MALKTDIFRELKMGKEVFHPLEYNTDSFTMNWTMEKGGKVPPHFHEYMNEHFTVTKGEVTFVVNGAKITKKTGEEFFVAKGVPHSIVNKYGSQIGLKVRYEPCADTHRLFEIIAVLDKQKPGSMVNMLKYFYLYPRLGLKPFSSVHPKFVMTIMQGIVTVVGKVSGWRKLVKDFN